MTLLTRSGNKRRLAKKLIPLFPEHNLYVEPFFGAGGIYFAKLKAKYNIINDLDSEVFNFWKVLQNRPVDFQAKYYNTPINSEIMHYWGENIPEDEVDRAVRFVLLSNHTYLGAGHTIRLEVNNIKSITLDRIPKVNMLLDNTIITNKDIMDFLKGMHSRSWNKKMFIYLDPPYINVENSYNTPKWRKENMLEMLDFLTTKECNFGISEFDSEFNRGIAEEYNLHYNIIGERCNI